jgi:hypothetical protein
MLLRFRCFLLLFFAPPVLRGVVTPLQYCELE